MLLMLVFSITNGYLSTLIMLAAIVDPSLEENEIDVSLTLLPSSDCADLHVVPDRSSAPLFHSRPV